MGGEEIGTVVSGATDGVVVANLDDRHRQPADASRATTSNKATDCESRMTGNVSNIDRGGSGDKTPRAIIPNEAKRFRQPKPK